MSAPDSALEVYWSRKTKHPAEYRKGADGFINWCEDNCCIPVYPEGSDIPDWYPMCALPPEYATIWEGQKAVMRQALEMKDGRFRYRLLVLCWPRGEGKSLVACLVESWKFFNWPRQQIVLGANSKEQTKFVHYDIIRDIILNSPKLLQVIGQKNIQEKEIRIVDKNRRVVSSIKSISSFTGIVSNVTGYTFSEMFDMKNPKFFVQLDGSIRNIPNALAVIDSTVSAKDHVLFKLYSAFTKQEDPTLYFSYRKSDLGESKDYWNPHMTQQQLNSYKAKFPFGEYERYFLNLWTAGQRKVFTEGMIEEMGVLGMDGTLCNHKTIQEAYEKVEKARQWLATMEEKKLLYGTTMDGTEQATEAVNEFNRRSRRVDTIYTLGGQFGGGGCATIDQLEQLGAMFDTGWSILSGFDRSDPMKTRPLARTVHTLVAKGLPGSLSNPRQAYNPTSVPKYIYLLLNLQVLTRNTLEEMKDILKSEIDEFDGIDTLCAERWGMWDMLEWCEGQGIAVELVQPTYDRQRAAFGMLYDLAKEGMIKAPTVGVEGYKEEDLWKEELRMFDHNVDEKWFGSPEKYDVGGVQDDSIFSAGWTIYGGRALGVEHLRRRRAKPFWGAMFLNRDVVGAY